MTTNAKSTKAKRESAEIITLNVSKEVRSDELLEKAQNARSRAKAIEFAKRALEINPDNIDAERFLLEFEDDDYAVIQKTKDLIEKEETSLKKRGIYTKENIGYFWEIFETRPFMRLKYDLARKFVELDKRRDAMTVYEEMLALCTNDNIGVRYSLISQYVFFEEYEKAEELWGRYENSTSPFMLLPMVVCYYKKDDFEKAESLWKALAKRNKHVERFLTQGISEEELEELEEVDCYQTGSVEEAFLIYRENLNLLLINSAFVTWLDEQGLVK